MTIGHIGINYDEGKHKDLSTAGYKGVEASYKTYNGSKVTGVVRKVFNSGDPAQDFANASFWIGSREDVETVMMSSSCDHFTMDVKPYGWYSNTIGGELIRLIKDKAPWHKVTRQYGHNEGRDAWVQDEGHFVILDNKDGIKIATPDGQNDTAFKTVEEAMDYCKSIKRKVTWE